ncbi:MAG: superinfection exclusion B family protein, partial [Acidobacteriota bacterium]|nr:superinfection exclusion B family protein [Acidobacteriota bacterium]
MSGDAPAWIRALGDLFKPRRLAAIWVVALLVLLSPRSLRTAVGVDALFQEFRGWVVVVFLLTVSLWVFELLPPGVRRWWENRR